MSSKRRPKKGRKFTSFGGKKIPKRKGKVNPPPKKPRKKPVKSPPKKPAKKRKPQGTKKLPPKRGKPKKGKSYRTLPKRKTKANYEYEDHEIDDIDGDQIDEIIDNETDGRRKTLVFATLEFVDKDDQIQYRSTPAVRPEDSHKLTAKLQAYAREYKAFTNRVVVTTTTARRKIRREVIKYSNVKRTVFRDSLGRFAKGK